MNQYFDILKKTKLFEHLPDIELQKILKEFDAKLVSYDKGEYCIRSQDSFDCICIMVEGTANIIREQIWGNVSLLSELEAGDMFAESYVLAKKAHIPVSVVATSSCKVVLLNYPLFVSKAKDMQSFSKIMERLLYVISTKNVAMNDKMDILSQRTTRDKVLLYLKKQAIEKESDSFSIPFDRSELADYLGVERSALSRELSKMQRDKLIQFEKKWFAIIDHE